MIHIGFDLSRGRCWRWGQDLLSCRVEVAGQLVVTPGLRGVLVLQPGDGAELVHSQRR